MMEIPRTFLEFIKSLNSRGVKFLLVGGFAVSYYGSPRSTNDIDFWIAISPKNASSTLKAIHDFGFTDAPVTEKQFLEKKKVFQMGREPMRIDILTGPSGVDFDDCWQKSIPVEFGGVPFRIINRDDLLKNKIASGRPKDLQDVDTLTKIAEKTKGRKRDKKQDWQERI